MDRKTRQERTKVSKDIKNAEKGEQIFTKWDEHILARHEIESFTTIVKDQLMQIKARENEILMPFSEYFGDHSENWIVIINKKTNEELARKSTKTVDMINWKLSSPLINIKKDGK